MKIDEFATIIPICGYGLEITDEVIDLLGYVSSEYETVEEFLPYLLRDEPSLPLVLLGEEGEERVAYLLIKANNARSLMKKINKLLCDLDLEDVFSFKDFKFVCDLSIT